MKAREHRVQDPAQIPVKFRSRQLQSGWEKDRRTGRERTALGRARPAGVCLRGFFIVSLRTVSSVSGGRAESKQDGQAAAEERAMRQAIRCQYQGRRAATGQFRRIASDWIGDRALFLQDGQSLPAHQAGQRCGANSEAFAATLFE